MRIAAIAIALTLAGCGPLWEGSDRADAGPPDAGEQDPFWYDAELLREVEPGVEIDSPAVLTDATGMTTLVWTEGPPAEAHLFARRRDPMDGTWSPAVRVDPMAPEGVGSPQLAADADGHVVVVWQQTWGSYQTIRAAWFDETLGWSGPSIVAQETGWFNVQPRVAVAPEGGAVVAWQRTDNAGTFEVWAARSDPQDSGWLPSERLDTVGTGPIEGLDVAIGGGEVVAMWSAFGGGRFDLWASPPATVIREGSGEPQLALDADGNGVAVWYYAAQVEAATYDGAGFGAPITLTEMGNGGTVAIAPRGQVIQGGYGAVTWSEGDRVRLRRFDEDRMWSEPEAIDASGAGFPALAFNPEGEGLVAWQETTEPEYHVSAARIGSGPLLPTRLDASTFAILGAVASDLVVWIQRDDTVTLWARAYR